LSRGNPHSSIFVGVIGRDKITLLPIQMDVDKKITSGLATTQQEHARAAPKLGSTAVSVPPCTITTNIGSSSYWGGILYLLQPKLLAFVLRGGT
jgi:hypothetical protein